MLTSSDAPDGIVLEQWDPDRRADRLRARRESFANQPQANTLRLSFVTVPKAKIDEGIERLGRLIADECAAIRHGHAAGDSESVGTRT